MFANNQFSNKNNRDEEIKNQKNKSSKNLLFFKLKKMSKEFPNLLYGANSCFQIILHSVAFM